MKPEITSASRPIAQKVMVSRRSFFGVQAASKKANSASAMKNLLLLVILVALDSRMAGKAGIRFAVALFVEEQRQKQNGFQLALE